MSQLSLSVNVHLDADTALGHWTFPDASSGRPFVSLHLGSSSRRQVALMIADPAVLTHVITAATAARADLVAALSRQSDAPDRVDRADRAVPAA